MPASCTARFLLHPDYHLYDFGPTHPLRPERIDASVDLLCGTGILRDEDVLRPSIAQDRDLERVHDPAYVRGVEDAGSAGLPRSLAVEFGLTSRDNPPFPGMHRAAALVAGGTAAALDAVLSGSAQHAFNGPGGLHHAHRSRASGFCVYNDAAVAIASAVEQGLRVLYLDFDAHHGDGVQWIFYTDPRVLTISFHESGRFLFPGTGETSERGDAAGAGYCVNVPFAPYTRDASWTAALDSIVPALARRFGPDVIVSVHGCDTHALDPLTHLMLSTQSFVAQAALTHALAHELCDGRWIALGSGGYDWRRVVPRAWTIVWTEMTGRPLPDELPPSWREAWLEGEDAPDRFLDAVDPAPRGTSGIEAANAATVRDILVQEELL